MNAKKIAKDQMKKVVGGTYYGNGVNCGKYTCTVNWRQAWNESLNRLGNSVVSGLTGLRQN